MTNRNINSEILQRIKNNCLEVKIRANSSKNDIILENDMIIVEIKAPPKNNKANLEIIKVFHKLTGRNVEILRGKSSRHKLLRFS